MEMQGVKKSKFNYSTCSSKSAVNLAGPRMKKLSYLNMKRTLKGIWQHSVLNLSSREIQGWRSASCHLICCQYRQVFQIIRSYWFVFEIIRKIKLKSSLLRLHKTMQKNKYTQFFNITFSYFKCFHCYVVHGSTHKKGKKVRISQSKILQKFFKLTSNLFI